MSQDTSSDLKHCLEVQGRRLQALKFSPETVRFKPGTSGSHVQSQRLRQKDCEFKVSLSHTAHHEIPGYRVRSCLKQKEIRQEGWMNLPIRKDNTWVFPQALQGLNTFGDCCTESITNMELFLLGNPNTSLTRQQCETSHWATIQVTVKSPGLRAQPGPFSSADLSLFLRLPDKW